MKKQVILHRGKKFASEGGGRFAKDVIHVGKWFHPVTELEVIVTPERVAELVKETTRYMEAGNKIPFRDGHRNSVLATMGEWTGPFIEHDGSLIAVVEPKDPRALEGMKNGSIDGVSVVIEYDYKDSKKNVYSQVITAIDATDFPVVTEQKGFVELSRDSQGNDVYFPESMKLDQSAEADGDCVAHHATLHKDLTSKMGDFSKKKAALGEHHPDTKAAASKVQDAAARLRKQAQVVHDHVQNMSGGPVYYDRTKPSPAAAASPADVLAEQIVACNLSVAKYDPDLFSTALLEEASKATPNGTFLSGVDGCVLHMKNQGYSDESARAICGKIANRAK